MSPRPKNIRKVRGIPQSTAFIPLHAGSRENICLQLEEYESLVLCDYEGKNQQEAALLMNVSRPTLTRIYASARKKIAEALVLSRPLLIEGGKVYVDSGWFRCGSCGLLFHVTDPWADSDPMLCPRCKTGSCESVKENDIHLIKYRNMKKIALPTRGGMIDDHFGHCEFYTIVTVNDENQIVLTETLPSPQGCGCKSNIASKLQEDGVSVMLAGNMGAGALNKLSACGIQVIRGCQGAVLEVVQAYLQGEIQDSGVACSHHQEGEGHQCAHHQD